MTSFRMSHLRWLHLLWIATGHAINHAVRGNVLQNLAGAGLLKKTLQGYQITPKGQEVVETERKALEALCRRDYGADINSIYFSPHAQSWMANYNTPQGGSAVARISRAWKGKISFRPMR